MLLHLRCIYTTNIVSTRKVNIIKVPFLLRAFKVMIPEYSDNITEFQITILVFHMYNMTIFT